MSFSSFISKQHVGSCLSKCLYCRLTLRPNSCEIAIIIRIYIHPFVQHYVDISMLINTYRFHSFLHFIDNWWTYAGKVLTSWFSTCAVFSLCRLYCLCSFPVWCLEEFVEFDLSVPDHLLLFMNFIYELLILYERTLNMHKCICFNN